MSQAVEQRLHAAAIALAAGPVPDLVPEVRRTLGARHPVGHRPTGLRLRPVVVAVLVVVLGVAALTAAVPSARVAVADFLGLSGVRIEVEPTAPDVGRALRLGARVHLAEARRAVTFPVRIPSDFGSPDEVWIDRDAVPGGQVTLLWHPRGGLPAAGPHGVGALLTLLPGRLEPGLVAKSVWQDGTTVTSVVVGDQAGWWVAGEEHALAYRDTEGVLRHDVSRLAGDTLLWQAGDVLYRLESGLSLPSALRVARSLD